MKPRGGHCESLGPLMPNLRMKPKRGREGEAGGRRRDEEGERRKEGGGVGWRDEQGGG